MFLIHADDYSLHYAYFLDLNYVKWSISAYMYG